MIKTQNVFYKIDFSHDSDGLRARGLPGMPPNFYFFSKVTDGVVEMMKYSGIRQNIAACPGWAKVMFKTDALIRLEDLDVANTAQNLMRVVGSVIANYTSGKINGLASYDVWRMTDERRAVRGAVFLTPRGDIVWISEIDQMFLKCIP